MSRDDKLQTLHDDLNLHKKVKETTGIYELDE